MSLQIVKTADKLLTSRAERAKELDIIARGAIFQLIYALKEMADKELFVELGYDCMRDYCLKELNFSATNAKYYMSISDKFGGYLQIANNGQHVDHGENANQIVENLTFTKLVQLSRLPDNIIEEFVETKVLKLKEAELTFDKIIKADRRDLNKLITRELEKQESSPRSKKQKQDKTLLDVRNNIKKYYKKFLDEMTKFPWEDDTRQEIGRLLVPLQDILTRNIENK